MRPEGIREQRLASNGIELNVAEQGEGPLVVMLHGFPDYWASWKPLMAELNKAGYRTAALDLRGYNLSDKPKGVAAYAMPNLVGDVAAVIAAEGQKDAVVIGHDWGAPTAWSCALHHPQEITAVGALSVPFTPRSAVPPLDAMRERFKGQFFYQLYFQEPGVAEAEFERDIRTALRKFLVMGAGGTDLSGLPAKGPDDDLLSGLPEPETLPDWLDEDDLDFYTAEFIRSGFRGPLNYYRNHNLTWQLTEGAPATVSQPAMFVAGASDGVILMASEARSKMPGRVPDLRVNELIPGIGHWTQQEAPNAVNRCLVKFLDEVTA